MAEKREYIIIETKKFIREIVNRYMKAYKQADKQDFYKRGLEEMERLIQRKYNFQGAKKRDMIYYEMLEESGAELRAYVDECYLDSRKRLLQQEVNSATAGFIIKEYLAPEGIPYFVEMQTYRAKISIMLSDKNKAVFYITYKKLQKDIEKVVPAVRQMQQIVKTFGRNTFLDIIRSGDSWEEKQ